MVEPATSKCGVLAKHLRISPRRKNYTSILTLLKTGIDNTANTSIPTVAASNVRLHTPVHSLASSQFLPCHVIQSSYQSHIPQHRISCSIKGSPVPMEPWTLRMHEFLLWVVLSSSYRHVKNLSSRHSHFSHALALHAVVKYLEMSEQ